MSTLPNNVGVLGGDVERHGPGHDVAGVQWHVPQRPEGADTQC
mgnify:CR=1 FL=1